MIKCLININGTEYATVMNNYVLAKLEEHGTSLDAVLNDDAHRISNICLLLHLMITAGSMWEKMNNEPPHDVISLDDLMMFTDTNSLQEFARVITETLQGDRKVHATPPKNAKATLEEKQPRKG